MVGYRRKLSARWLKWRVLLVFLHESVWRCCVPATFSAHLEKCSRDVVRACVCCLSSDTIQLEQLRNFAQENQSGCVCVYTDTLSQRHEASSRLFTRTLKDAEVLCCDVTAHMRRPHLHSSRPSKNGNSFVFTAGVTWK